MTISAYPRTRPLMRLSAAALASFLLLGCAGITTTKQANAPSDASSDAPTDRFLAAIARHCGQAYAGRVLVDTPATPNNPFADKALVMHVRECKAGEVRIPFHVGEDRSRTWVLTRTPTGLRLKHDHRHEDGSPDKVTLYGGDTAELGTVGRQAFPVDAESIANFQANGLTASVNNTWAMEISQDRFVYELSRPNGRLFQVEFDLRRPVSAPPAPWAAD